MPDAGDVTNYLDGQGRVTSWPSRRYRKSQRAVLDYLATKFEMDHHYTERQVNELLLLHHTFNDSALLRRELIVAQLLARERDGSAYWRVTAKADI